MNVPPEHMLVLAAVLFGLGVLGFLLRRNVIVVLASVELLLNAANLSFLAGARMHSGPDGLNLLGPVFAVFVILVAAAEAAVGLAIVIALYRLKQTVHLDQVAELRADLSPHHPWPYLHRSSPPRRWRPRWTCSGCCRCCRSLERRCAAPSTS